VLKIGIGGVSERDHRWKREFDVGAGEDIGTSSSP